MPGTIYYILAIMRAKKAWLLSSWSLQSGGWNRYSNDHINESMITNCQECYEGEENSVIKASNRET